MSLDSVGNFELRLRYNLAVKIIEEAKDDPRVEKIYSQLEILKAEMERRGLLNKNVNPVEDANKDEKNLVVKLDTLSLWSEAGDT